jgi:hypothetical protein
LIAAAGRPIIAVTGATAKSGDLSGATIAGLSLRLKAENV